MKNPEYNSPFKVKYKICMVNFTPPIELAVIKFIQDKNVSKNLKSPSHILEPST